jgi:hypothetical protein
MLQLYAINENSVLVMSEDWLNVDVKRMGNIQPQTPSECIPQNFFCNGCSEKNMDDPRYMCMGCRREPTIPDYVDFCTSC